MRYQFNSFSLPAADLATLFATARRYGYEGIELRLAHDHGHGVEVSIDAAARRRFRAAIARSGLRVDCLCTSARLAVPETVEESADAARRAIELAADLGVPYVRVFGGHVPEGVSRGQAMRTLIEALRSLAAHAHPRGVTVLLETHDDWATPAHLVEVLTAVDHPGAGILWDVWHTGRTGHSSIGDAHRALSPWIRHVQMHDGLLARDRLHWRPIGQGEVDHLELLGCLTAGGYRGAIAGEWIDWEPADTHLPRELATMRAYERLLGTAVS